jgi:hypothetical protein
MASRVGFEQAVKLDYTLGRRLKSCKTAEFPGDALCRKTLFVRSVITHADESN